MTTETEETPEDIANDAQNEADAVEESGQDEMSEKPLDQQLQEAVEECNAANEKALRAQAELENYRRRVQKETEQNAKYAGIFLIRDILPGLDNLARAVQAAESTGNTADLIQGVQMVSKQFEDILSRHSATPIKSEGEAFDPNKHEAIQQIPTDEHPPMTVLQEVERGYVLHDRVIRPSKVLVSAPLPQAAAEADGSAGNAESQETENDE
ncbi:MAG: nucleotide exchange factor GrpE [Planctomycetaceae bacterium]|nr:nucleotide exchange factor GrpE [Planctomycetaceae bacterium]